MASIREIKFDVTWSYVKRQTAKMTSEFVFFSSNPLLNHIKMEKCLLLIATNTNIFTPLFNELKTDGKSFTFAVCRLTYDHVTSNLISLFLAYGWRAGNLNWPIRIRQAGKNLVSSRQCKLTGKALKPGIFSHWRWHEIFTKGDLQFPKTFHTAIIGCYFSLCEIFSLTSSINSLLLSLQILERRQWFGIPLPQVCVINLK